jgi:hypothetical protein
VAAVAAPTRSVAAGRGLEGSSVKHYTLRTAKAGGEPSTLCREDGKGEPFRYSRLDGACSTAEILIRDGRADVVEVVDDKGCVCDRFSRRVHAAGVNHEVVR